jgi:hypothetical protein
MVMKFETFVGSLGKKTAPNRVSTATTDGPCRHVLSSAAMSGGDAASLHPCRPQAETVHYHRRTPPLQHPGTSYFYVHY